MSWKIWNGLLKVGAFTGIGLDLGFGDEVTWKLFRENNSAVLLLLHTLV